MAIRKILTLHENERELRKLSRPVERFDARLHDLLDDMAQTMNDAGGVGLAAPQVGILRRTVVIDCGEYSDGILTYEGEKPRRVTDRESTLLELVNPTITLREGSREWEEGCLSVPGYRGHTVRPQHVKLQAQDRFGKSFTLEGFDLLALAMVHECEHLDGKVYVDAVRGDLYKEEDEA